ncbi:MAG: sugar ABC transporter substrate-binding protein [Geminicoccaceae bacterium]|nr:sugar ABC transporter substrate-binding protein [Geminicoccaceae bacterium]
MDKARFAIGAAGLTAALLATTAGAQAQTTLTIATVNNGDMVVMQKLSSAFEEQHPDIKLDWVVLEENVLRQRVTTDIATKGGQFDVMTIGTYETPIWAKQGWLVPFDNLPEGYAVDDILKPVREALTYEGKLYALPFYAESSMLFYRKDLFKEAGIEVPDQPKWDEVKGWADKLNKPGEEQYGICLRGKPGWGENMAFVTTLANTFGGRLFNEQWEPQLDSDAWKKAVTFYVDLLKEDGPPGASSNGFNENLALFSTGKCAMWVDATVAAGLLSNPANSQVADEVGFAKAPIASWPKGANWLWAWSLGVPATSDSVDAAKTFVEWATSKDYIKLVADKEGWVAAPPGTRESTYASQDYMKAAPFAEETLAAIQSADPVNTTEEPKPYSGVQYAGIPEFQGIGTMVGQMIAAALTGQMSVDQALQSAQSSTERTMRQAGYFDK